MHYSTLHYTLVHDPNHCVALVYLYTCFQSAQASSLRELQDSLKEHGVDLQVTYSQTLHDREIRQASLPDHPSSLHAELVGSISTQSWVLTELSMFPLHRVQHRYSNGWIVKIGRGLDYFHKPKVI